MKTKSFISEDAIQRIASGNGETSQTLISLDVIKNVLKPHQLRNVLGGCGGNSCGSKSSSGQVRCNISRTEAIFWAACQDIENGTNCDGNWCCDNCGTASYC